MKTFFDDRWFVCGAIFVCLVSVCGLCGCGKTVNETGSTVSKSLPVKSEDPAPPIRRAEGLVTTDDDRHLIHTPSQTEFFLPYGWEVQSAGTQFGVTFVKFADSESTATGKISWIPLLEPLADSLTRNYSLLQKRYGAENVSKRRLVKVNGQTGHRIDLKASSPNDFRRRCVIYDFVVIPGVQNRWRIRLRVIIDAKTDAKTVDAIARKLVHRFQWQLKKSGPVIP